jgi:hypothetical protein
MTAKLARLTYRMPRCGMKYVNQGAEFYEARHRKQQIIHLKRKAAQLGLEIIEVAAAASNHDWEFLKQSSWWSSWRERILACFCLSAAALVTSAIRSWKGENLCHYSTREA